MAEELLAELAAKGYDVSPDQLGENITTQGLDLLGLPKGSHLKIGSQVVLVVTGLRNPCWQIENFKAGLLAEVLTQNENGDVVRRAGIMSIVERGGMICRGDEIVVKLPDQPFNALKVV